MLRIFVFLFSMLSLTAVAGGEQTIENLAAHHTHVLANLYHELGNNAQSAGLNEKALYYHTKAAELSLDERKLNRSTSPKFCGVFAQSRAPVSVGRSYCAATLELCKQTLSAAEKNATPESSSTFTMDCGPVYGE